jgi:hypothetical protein
MENQTPEIKKLNKIYCKGIRPHVLQRLIWFGIELVRNKELRKKIEGEDSFYEIAVDDIPVSILKFIGISKRTAYDYLQTLRSLSIFVF